MKIEEQVCTAQQSFKLKELGVIQEGQYTWYEVSDGSEENQIWHPVLTAFDRRNGMDMAIERIDSDLLTSDGEFCDTRHTASAFTVAELGVMLGEQIKYARHMNEALCRADLLIHLLETGKITPATCNARLTA